MSSAERSRAVVVGVIAVVMALAVVLSGPTVGEMLHADDRFTNDEFPHPSVECCGYDSQFFYRSAVSPLSGAEYAGGVRFDSGAYRQQRVGYPAMAWLASGGNPHLVPWTLVAVNVVAFVAIALGGGRLASRRGHSPLWGLTFALYPGFVLALRWNLSEVVAGAFLIWALVVMRSRPWLAGLLLAGAVLTRETTILIPLTLCASTVTRHRMPSATWIPSLTLAGVWQVVLWMRWGAPGPVSQPASNIGAPLRGMIDLLGSSPPLGDLAALAVLVAVVVAAAGSLRRLDHWLAAPWVVALVLPVLSTHHVWWRSLSFTRAAMEAWVLSVVVILCAAEAARRGTGGLSRGGYIELDDPHALHGAAADVPGRVGAPAWPGWSGFLGWGLGCRVLRGGDSG